MTPQTEQLLDQFFDGEATDAEWAQLANLLSDDRDLRIEFARRSRMEQSLRALHVGRMIERDVARGKRRVDTAPLTQMRTPIILNEPISRFRIGVFASTLAAALLVAAAIVALYVFNLSPGPAGPVAAAPAPVATLIESTGNLTTPSGFVAGGHDYPSGEYTLDAGTAEFMLTNAVNVKLRGETRMSMHNDMNVSLTRGSADFVVPRDAQGFTVHLRGGRKIVDLGTAFSVSVEDKHDILRVTEGFVQLVTQVDGQPITRTVRAGDAGRFTRDGTLDPFAPAVRYAGAHRSTDGKLRNTDADNHLDPDGDNAYGTDGHVFWGTNTLDNELPHNKRAGQPIRIGRRSALPPYIAAVDEAPDTVVARGFGYLAIDDPAAEPSASPDRVESGSLVIRRDPAASPAHILTVRVGANPPAGGFRLGVLVDNQKGKSLVPRMIRVESVHDHAEVTTIDAGKRGDGDLYAFDITSIAAGDELRILAAPNGSDRPAVLVGVTFDPLPAPPEHNDASSGDNRPDALAPDPYSDPVELQTTGPEKPLRKVRSERDEN